MTTPFIKPDTPPSGTHIIAVIDRSGSMQSRRGEVIEGFNAFIQEQVRDNERLGEPAFLTLITFNEFSQTHFFRQPIEKFNRLDETNYITAGGTALLDAVGQAINAHWRKDDKVVVFIQTDGEENSSRTFDLQRLKALIEQKQSEGWLFIFTGANLDSYHQAASMGINLATVANYSDKKLGQTRAVYANVSGTVSGFRGGASGQSLSSTLRAGLDDNEKAP